jgi:RimJ/RimL family protein N-acetyltransferase
VADAPVLETPRLRLRGHTLEDFDAVAAMWADPETVRFIGKGEPFGEDVVWPRLQRSAGAWPILGYGFWAIEHAASGRLIGEAGFLEQHPPGEGPRTPEAGWMLESAAWGQGYAGEAVAAMLAWGDQRFARTTCIISPENAPSIALARRHGYREVGPAPLPPGWTGPVFVAFERERPPGLG